MKLYQIRYASEYASGLALHSEHAEKYKADIEAAKFIATLRRHGFGNIAASVCVI